MNNHTIYIHINKINKKVYIGQTCQNPKKRWENGKGYDSCPRFYNAILKYGWDNFEHIILFENLSLQQANQKEKELIKKYNSTDEKYGYNITSGGSNFHHSEETKRKIGQSNKIALKGITWSQQHKQKISQMFTGQGNPFYGKHHTQQSKEKISNNRKGKNIGKQHPFYGKHHTKQSKEKISNNRKGKGGKKVRCINTGQVFNTMMDAARWCGLINSSSIGQVCNKTGKQKTAGKHPITKEKLLWEFIEENNE